LLGYVHEQTFKDCNYLERAHCKFVSYTSIGSSKPSATARLTEMSSAVNIRRVDAPTSNKHVTEP